MITVKHIDTIDGIQDLIFEQTYNAAIDRTRSSYFYRGMPDASYTSFPVTARLLSRSWSNRLYSSP